MKQKKKKFILASMLVLALNFLFVSSESFPLNHEYYNLRDNTCYSNLDKCINKKDSQIIIILSKLPSYFFLRLLFNINYSRSYISKIRLNS